MKKNKTKEIKCPRYRTMRTHSEVSCPHYEGDGYMYKFDAIEFNFCNKCNRKLLNQMIDQFKIEISEVFAK